MTSSDKPFLPDNSAPEDSAPEDRLPETVIRRLQEADRVPFQVSAEQHAQILQQARQHLIRIPAIRPGRRWLKFSAVIGSVCAALLIIAFTRLDPPAGNQPSITSTERPEVLGLALQKSIADPGDIDENGIVDILDAYALARRLESGDSNGPWDLNSDGQLDEDDVRTVALQAVML